MTQGLWSLLGIEYQVDTEKMNAVLVPEAELTSVDELEFEVPEEVSPPAPTEPTVAPAPTQIGFGAAQARVLPAAILFVFALTTIGLYAYRGDLAGSVGIAAYLSMWLGGGFGFLGGGILWAIGEMEKDGIH